MKEPNPDETGNEIDDEMLNILAAFGDDALDMLEDDDDLEDPGDLGVTGLEGQAVEPGSPQPVPTESTDNASATDDLFAQLSRKYGERINEDSSLSYAGSIAMACSRAVDAPPRADSRCVVFETGDQVYGIALDSVVEIARCGHLTALPRTPQWLCGVTNLRGQIFSVIDLNALLASGKASASDQPAGTSPVRTASGSGKVIFVRGSSRQMSTAILVQRVIGIRGFTKTSEDVSRDSPALTSVSGGIATIDSRDPSRSAPSCIALIDADKLLESTTLMA